jgi:TATA-box binding protein (TBP) (component of TFIID and TFIIIB)
MPGRKRTASEAAVHAVDGAPVPIVERTGPGQRSQPTCPRIDLSAVVLNAPSSDTALPSVAGATTGMARDVMLNNCVGTARLGPTVPNMIAMSSLGAGKYSIGRNLKLVTKHAHIIAHARSGVLNLAGARSYDDTRIAISEYILLAARTGTIVELRSVGVHNMHVTFTVGQIDLARLAERYVGGGYRPHVINLLTLKFSNPRCTTNVFQTGKVVLLGIKHMDQVDGVVAKVARLLSPFVVRPTLPSTVSRGGERVRPSIADLRESMRDTIPIEGLDEEPWLR